MSTELVPVFSGEIAGCPVQLVDARLLHGFLEVVSKFADWIKNRIDDYGFLKDQDYVEVFLRNEKNPKGGRPTLDYHLTLDMAKELAMVERNEKGRQVRRYFIECERRAWSGTPNALRQLPDQLPPVLPPNFATPLRAYLASRNQVTNAQILTDLLGITSPQDLRRLAPPLGRLIGREFPEWTYQHPRVNGKPVYCYRRLQPVTVPQVLPDTLPLFEGQGNARVLVILHGKGRFTATSLTDRHLLVDLDDLLAVDRAMDAWRNFAQQRELDCYRVRTDPPKT